MYPLLDIKDTFVAYRNLTYAPRSVTGKIKARKALKHPFVNKYKT
jgi:hypothetical protein